jgi:hypothetical protein
MRRRTLAAKGSMGLLADRDPEEARKLLDPVLELMVAGVDPCGPVRAGRRVRRARGWARDGDRDRELTQARPEPTI